MATVRKGKIRLHVYGRKATAAEQTRFKEFVDADRVRDRQRKVSDANTLEIFTAKLKDGSFSNPTPSVSWHGVAQEVKATKRAAKSQKAPTRRAKAVAVGTK